MAKPQTAEDKRAAFKAKDDADRRDRAGLDAETLDAIIAKTETARAAVAEVEALCGDLVSDLSSYALKAQASAGPSTALGHILTLAQQSRAAVEAALSADAG